MIGNWLYVLEHFWRYISINYTFGAVFKLRVSFPFTEYTWLTFQSYIITILYLYVETFDTFDGQSLLNIKLTDHYFFHLIKQCCTLLNHWWARAGFNSKSVPDITFLCYCIFIYRLFMYNDPISWKCLLLLHSVF